MFRRFAAASAVASVVIGAGAAISLLPPRWPAADANILLTAWCFVPLVWGLWAMLAPAGWVPRRFGIWGAILGLGAGIVAGPVFDFPLRLAGLRGFRWMPVVAGPAVYFLLWMAVGAAYRRMDRGTRAAS